MIFELCCATNDTTMVEFFLAGPTAETLEVLNPSTRIPPLAWATAFGAANVAALLTPYLESGGRTLELAMWWGTRLGSRDTLGRIIDEVRARSLCLGGKEVEGILAVADSYDVFKMVADAGFEPADRRVVLSALLEAPTRAKVVIGVLDSNWCRPEDPNEYQNILDGLLVTAVQQLAVNEVQALLRLGAQRSSAANDALHACHHEEIRTLFKLGRRGDEFCHQGRRGRPPVQAKLVVDAAIEAIQLSGDDLLLSETEQRAARARIYSRSPENATRRRECQRRISGQAAADMKRNLIVRFGQEPASRPEIVTLSTRRRVVTSCTRRSAPIATRAVMRSIF
jgi:hypothetical protein